MRERLMHQDQAAALKPSAGPT